MLQTRHDLKNEKKFIFLQSTENLKKIKTILFINVRKAIFHK